MTLLPLIHTVKRVLIFNEYTQEDIEVMHNDMQLGFNFKNYYQLTQALKEIVVIDDNNCITLPDKPNPISLSTVL